MSTHEKLRMHIKTVCHGFCQDKRRAREDKREGFSRSSETGHGGSTISLSVEHTTKMTEEDLPEEEPM